jgi:GAF domain-containing protein
VGSSTRLPRTEPASTRAALLRPGRSGAPVSVRRPSACPPSHRRSTPAKPSLSRSEATSITLIHRKVPFTAAHDGQLAWDADELQYERDYGPCVDASRSGQVFLVEDMRTEQRWPDYAQQAAVHRVGSSLSVPLPFQSATIGALNNYASRPDAFGLDDLVLGEEVAAWGWLWR